MITRKPENKNAELLISRDFQAPIQSVFEALSNPEALAKWWGPVGYTMTFTIFDFRPGGLCLFKMENEASTMWARFIYGQIINPESVEFTLSFSDEKGGLTRAPFFDHWPLEIHNVISLKEHQGMTTLSIHCYPVHATAEELASFNENKSSFHQGLSASLDKLKVYFQGK